jgi:uncharacterized membrane protein
MRAASRHPEEEVTGVAQYNVNPPDEVRRDTGMGTVLAVLLVLALVAFLIWALAFGGFNSLTGTTGGSLPSYSSTAPSGSISSNSYSSGTTSGGSSSSTGSTSSAPTTKP